MTEKIKEKEERGQSLKWEEERKEIKKLYNFYILMNNEVAYMQTHCRQDAKKKNVYIPGCSSHMVEEIFEATSKT